MVDHHLQVRCEALGFGRPVADDRGWGDHKRPAAGADTGEVREHGWGLAETHVQRQAAAEIHVVEEPQPLQGFGLVAAQFTVEPGRARGRIRGDLPGPVEEVRRPPVALYAQASKQGALEAQAVAEDLGAGERRHRRSLGERGRRLLQVGVIELDPAAVRAHQRARFGRQLGDVGRGEFDVAEHRAPADIAQLVDADHRGVHRLGEQSQRRPRLAPRQRRHPDLEAGDDQVRAAHRHQLPRLVLAQIGLTSPGRSRAEQLR